MWMKFENNSLREWAYMEVHLRDPSDYEMNLFPCETIRPLFTSFV